jgi:hypothetical protein
VNVSGSSSWVGCLATCLWAVRVGGISWVGCPASDPLLVVRSGACWVGCPAIHRTVLVESDTSWVDFCVATCPWAVRVSDGRAWVGCLATLQRVVKVSGRLPLLRSRGHVAQQLLLVPGEEVSHLVTHQRQIQVEETAAPAVLDTSQRRLSGQELGQPCVR